MSNRIKLPKFNGKPKIEKMALELKEKRAKTLEIDGKMLKCKKERELLNVVAVVVGL